MADAKEVRRLLDNPDVPPEDRKLLVHALVTLDPFAPDLYRYARANGVPIPLGMGMPVEPKAVEKIVEHARERANLARTGRALQETGDVATSDQLLDDGAPGLRFFDTFFPVSPQAAQLCGFSGGPAADAAAVHRSYDELRGIDFGAFREDAHRIDGAAEAATSAKLAMSQAFATLATSWQGRASDAALRYNAGFLAGGDTVVANTKRAAGVVLAGASAIQTTVRTFTQQVHGLANEQCGGQDLHAVRENIRKAQGRLELSDLGVGDVLGGIGESLKDAFVGGLFGGLVGGVVGLFKGAFDSGRDIRKKIIEKAKADLGHFCGEFAAKHQQFTTNHAAAKTQVQNCDDRMVGELGAAGKNPFSDQDTPPDLRGGRNGTGTGGDGRAGTPGSGGREGGVPGSGGPVGGAGSGVTTPEQSVPPDQPGAGQPGAGQPGAGQPAPMPVQVSPGSVPGVPGGTGARENVTIRAQDGSQVSVTSPDAAGHVKLTVGEGGGARTYDVDVTKGAATVEVPAQPGSSALAGQPGQTGAPAMTPAPGSEGKVVVREGGLTITTERLSGHPDQLTVTVDPGAGQPSTSTVDAAGPAQHAAGSAQDAAGSAQPAAAGPALTAPTTPTAPGGAPTGAATGGHGAGAAALIGGLAEAAGGEVPGNADLADLADTPIPNAPATAQSPDEENPGIEEGTASFNRLRSVLGGD